MNFSSFGLLVFYQLVAWQPVSRTRLSLAHPPWRSHFLLSHLHTLSFLVSSAFLELPLGIVCARWIKAVPVAFLPVGPQLKTITSEQTREKSQWCNHPEKNQGQRRVSYERTDDVDEPHPDPVGREAELGSGNAGDESKCTEGPEEFSKTLTTGKNPPVDKVKKRPDQPERRRHDQRPLPHFAGRRVPGDVHGSGAAEGRSDR